LERQAEWGWARDAVRIRRHFLDRYEVQQVGGKTLLEYWIPAEDLHELNRNIAGLIEVVSEFR